MFSASELEGEVDHAFFDSDCEDGISREGRELTAKKEISPRHKKLQTTREIHVNTDGSNKYPRLMDNNRQVERKETQSKENEQGQSLSADCKSDKIHNNGNDSEEEAEIHAKESSNHCMALMAEAKEVDGYAEDDLNDTEQEVLDVKFSSSKQSNKKRIRNRCRATPGASAEENGDTDSESSSSDMSSLESATHPKPNRTSSPKDRGSRVGSAAPGDTHSVHTDESDDTVTDVSPLSSPDSSRLQSLDLNHSEAEEDSPKEQQDSVPSSGLSNIQQDDNSSQADECSLDSETQLGGLVHFPGGRHRKNYSFTNNEVQRIDRENQRLLRQLSHFPSASRPGSTSGQRRRVTCNTPLNRLPHSALNRQREQQRIERENLAFLRRLESVKPTPGIKRSEQLADYQRQVGYLGIYPIYQPTTKKSTSGASSVSKGLRQSKGATHSARAASSATDLSSPSVSKSKKTNAAQPAWS